AVVDDGPRRHGDNDVLGGASGLLGPLPWPAARSADVLAIDDVGETIGAGDGADDDAAPIAAVAAIRAALRFVLPAPEAATAPTPVAAFDEDGDSIDKHTCGPSF